MDSHSARTADLLDEIGQRLVLQGGNPYRARAYNRAAEGLRTLTIPLDEVLATGRLREIPGVGESIAAIIPTLHATGTHPLLQELRSDIPATVLEMLAIPGLKPEKVLALFRELGIRSVQELETSARSGALSRAKRFGPALERRILQGIEALRAAHGRIHLHRAAERLAVAEIQLRQAIPGVAEVVPAGDFRRGCELVGDLILVATAGKRSEVLPIGDVSCLITEPARLGVNLLLATGSSAHLEQLRNLARAKGYTLGPDGLQHGRKRVSRTEASIYEALDLPYIPPELREGTGEIERAHAGSLPELVSAGDISGILHAHTTASDGANTLEEMAAATMTRGYTYLGVSDHSQSAHYAGGLKLPAIEAQHQAIDRLNATYRGRFRILKGIEADIREDGSLDYPDEILAEFDFVIASVHGKFRLDQEAQTRRILRAVSNPFTTILGHMTGRQLLRRPGYEVDVETILQACAEHGVAVEINANPWRLDLDWRWHRRALELGCTMSINPDAHSTDELDLLQWGLLQARKGGVPKRRVLNCLSLPKLMKVLSDRRERAI